MCVAGVLSLVVIAGAIAFLMLTYKGIIRTPTFLQPPPEGSGFNNPVAARDDTFKESPAEN